MDCKMKQLDLGGRVEVLNISDLEKDCQKHALIM